MKKKLHLIRKLCTFGKTEPWMVMLSILSAFSTVAVIYQNSSIELNSFRERIIGFVTLCGIDAAYRAQLYMLMVAVFIGVFFAAFALCSLLNSWARQNGAYRLIKAEKSVLFVLSICAIQLFILYVLKSEYLSREEWYFKFLCALWFLIIITLALAVTKVMSFRNGHSRLVSLFSNYHILVLNLCMPVVIIFAGWVIFGGSFTFRYRHLCWFSALCICFYLAYYCVLQIAGGCGIIRRKIDNALITCGIPLLIIPLSIPLANELQFTLSGIMDISPRCLSCAIILFLSIVSIYMFFRAIRRPTAHTSSSKIIRNIYFPLIIAASVLFTCHQHFFFPEEMTYYPTWANELLPTQQLFSFHSIPFVQLYPEHGLSVQLSQFLYSLINGYRPIEPFLWAWINEIGAVILLYFLIKKIMNSLYSLLFALVFPVAGIFWLGTFLFSCFVPAFSLIWLLKKVNYSRFAIYWVVCVSMVLWRIDFGIATAVASAFILFVLYCAKCINGESVKHEVRLALGSFLMVAGSAILISILIIIAGGESVRDIFALYTQFVKYRGPAVACAELFDKYSPLAVFQYLILPSVSVFYIVYFVYKGVFKKQGYSSLQVILVFLAVFSLAMFTRSTLRACLGADDYPNTLLFLFLAMCVPFYLQKFDKNNAIIISSILLAMYLVAFPGFGNYVKTGRMFSFQHWHNKETRVRTNDHQFDNLINFLDTYLHKDQTFYEVTDVAALYILDNRKCIAYFGPQMYRKSEVVQNNIVARLEKALREDKVPFIIFKSSCGYDYYDWVPNEISSYRVAEFIYKHYKPFGYIDRFQIWIDNKFDRRVFGKIEKTVQALIFKSKEQFKCNDIIRVRQEHGINIIECGDHQPSINNFLDLSMINPLDTRKYWFLNIQYRASGSSNIGVFFNLNSSSFNPQDCSNVNTVYAPGFSNVLVPMPVADGKNVLSDVRLALRHNAVFEIKSVELVSTTTRLVPIDTIQQGFHLMSLPYIWGTYDEYNASQNTDILQTLLDSKRMIDVGEPLDLALNPEIDKRSGNYLHFRMRADQAVAVTVSYGDGMPSAISFMVPSSHDIKDYLVRISSQWKWASEPINSITVSSGAPVEIHALYIRNGD